MAYHTLQNEPSVAVLDDALRRVSGLTFKPPSRFVSHAPMAAEALSVLGREEVIPAWMERWETELGPDVRPADPSWGPRSDWRARLGDRSLRAEWIGFFELTIAELGWRETVKTWTPRLIPALACSLFHGVIRTSHAVRSMEAADTEPRRAELARALGLWATWFSNRRPIGPAPLSASDPVAGVLASAAGGAASFLTQPSILELHGVTGAMAVHLLTGYLSEADAAAAFAQLRAEHNALYAGTPPTSPAAVPGDWEERAAVAAAASFDAHQVKLVEACVRGYRYTGDDAFAAAALAVTS